MLNYIQDHLYIKQFLLLYIVLSQERINDIGLGILSIIIFTAFIGISVPPAHAEVTKAALVMDASIDDIGWGTSHHQGLLALEEKLGYEVSLSEKTPPAEWETTTRDYAERGYKYVIMGGAQFTDLTKKIAPDYPNTTFLVVAAVPPFDSPYPANMIGVDMMNEQSGYLAGILAGGMTKSNIVGSVQGIDYPDVIRWNEAFKLGVLTQNPQATVLEVYTGSWDDLSKGYEATKGQMDAGADVIWQYLDLGAVGAAKAVKENPDVWLISNTNDQSFLAPDVTLSSALQGIPTLILQGVEKHEAGIIKGGEFYRWGINEGVSGLAPYHETESKIPSALKSKIAEIKNQMMEGTFVVPEIYDKQGYKNFLETPVAEAEAAQPEAEGGGCLIATAAFGSEMAPQVQF
ncbi:MAG TPA: BMP family ABC transporter substrate-binding protein, partial [Flavobacteriales bacterium]|nr:BMP family ABC transporter substrate-binding protein [Flavobacteriales bacterium]